MRRELKEIKTHLTLAAWFGVLVVVVVVFCFVFLSKKKLCFLQFLTLEDLLCGSTLWISESTFGNGL